MEREKLARARYRKRWTLEEASERLGVDKATLQRWEKGRASPQAMNLQRICEVYEMSAEELGFAEQILVPINKFPMLTMLLHEDLTVSLIQTVMNWRSNAYDELQRRILALFKDYNTMKDAHSEITRRDALRRLAVIPFATIGFDAAASLIRFPEETLKQCAAAMTACWELSKSSNKRDVQIAFEGVSAYLPMLKAIVKDSSLHRQTAAALVAQGSLLRTILGWHRESADKAMLYARDAMVYGEASGDLPLRVAILVQCSWLSYYAHQDKKALEFAGQAVSLLKEIRAPIPADLQSSAQGTFAVQQARHGDDQAMRSARISQEYYFRGSEPGGSFIYVDHDWPSLILVDGIAHAHAGLHSQALESFGQIIDINDLSLKLPVAERVRIEVLNNQVRSLLKVPQKEKELSIKLWIAAIKGAKSLQSEQRFSEAVMTYDIMEALWSNEKDIRELRPLTAHW